MTCASCVNRIERFLRKTPGVETATVNLATEMATIRYLPDVAGPAGARRRDRGGRLRRPRAAADRCRTRRRRPSPSSCRRAISSAIARRAPCSLRASVSIVAALAIMVVMFAPQTALTHGAAQLARPHPGDVHPVLGRRPLLPRGLARRAARHDQHGHARRARHDARRGPTASSSPSWPQVVVAAGLRARDLLRLLDDHHRPRPARALARGAGQGPHDRRDPAARRAAARRPPGSCATASTTEVAARGRPAGRPAARPAGRQGPGRRASSSRAARRSTSRC